MSILDSIKSAATEGLHLAGSVEKLAENGLGSLAHETEKVLSTTAKLPELALHSASDGLASAVSAFFPGVGAAKSLVEVGNNLLKSKTTGDLFKIQATSSIASLIPGLGTVLGPTVLAAGLAAESQSQAKNKDAIFNYVSSDEWKQILSQKDQSNGASSKPGNSDSSVQTDSASTNKQTGADSNGNAATAKNEASAPSLDGIVPKAHVDANGVEFERTAYDTKLNSNDRTTTNDRTTVAKPGQVKIQGDTAIHTDADGTVTTQTAGHTEIHHDGRTIVKDTPTGVVKDVVGNRVAYQQNTQNHTQEWNTTEGLRIVEQNGEYQIFNKDGSLIGTRPVSVIASEVQEETQTLSNGDQMHRHLSGRMMDCVRAHLMHRVPDSGKEWDVYSDGVSRTLRTGETVGILSSQDAFVQLGNTTIVRKAEDKKYYLIQSNGQSSEIKIDNSTLNDAEKKAVAMLHSIDSDKKIHLGDGTFLTVRNGKVVGGTDEIVDEPVTSGTHTDVADATAVPKRVEVAMVTTGNNTSTSILSGGFESTYDFNSHKSTITKPGKTGTDEKPKPIVEIDDKSLTTADVITTKQGTTDRVTHDVISHDGSIATSNGIKVSANNDIAFADGVKFSHDGTVTMGDGTVVREGTESANKDAAAQQASSAMAAALNVANAIAGKAANGTITFDDIALLQASIFDVQSAIGNCMANGNLEVAQSLMKTSAGLDAALGAANKSFAANTALRAMRSNAPANNNAGTFSFLNQYRAA